MKSRHGFVSNSSSSSFICDVCGTEICGMDICLEDWDFCECIEGHVMCQDHLIGNLDDVDDMYEIPVENCPVCQFKVISGDDMERYLLKISGLGTYKNVEKVIKEKFNSYNELDKFCSGE